MDSTILQALKPSVAVVAATVLAIGCASDAPLAPDRRLAPSAGADSDHASRAVDLDGCENLRAPAGSKLASRMYAEGVQIYRWDGAGWAFVAPSATLYANARAKGVVGTHYAGPTWESVSGSKVVGAVLERCTPDADAIPWLSLGAASNEGHGVFRRVTFIQRVQTVGGKAPAAPGSSADQEARVPYTAEYLFYRAR